MDTDRDDTATYRGAEYRHPDGTIEIVFESTAGRVLTVREYPTREGFVEAIATAEFEGENREVANLPDVDAFVDRPNASDDGDEPF
jgi:hypothetical protein